jgi:hypothetical protein
MATKVPSEPVEAFRLGEVVGRVLTYCEQVKAGAKLVGELGILRSDMETVRNTVDGEGCRVEFRERRSGERITAEVFFHPWVQVLLAEVHRGQGNGPPSALDVWVSGKLFGYSDHEVASFLSRRGYVKEPTRSAS